MTRTVCLKRYYQGSGCIWNSAPIVSRWTITSATIPLQSGVPQNSVLGPVMSILYTTTMQRIFKRHGLKYHRYTYDIVRHSSATPGDQVETARPSPHRPIGEVRRWMPLRMLKLNGEKTRTMVFASTHNV